MKIALRILPFALIAGLIVGLGLSMIEVQPPVESTTQVKEAATIARPQAGSERPPIPNAAQLTLILHSYLVALSHANLTNNYTVLHAFGAPTFKEENPPEKLSQIFANMRKSDIDLSPIVVARPILVRQPTYDEQGLLHITGYYDTQPQRVHFDVTLQPVAGLWRLFGVTVGAKPAQSATTPATADPGMARQPSGSQTSGGDRAGQETELKVEPLPDSAL